MNAIKKYRKRLEKEVPAFIEEKINECMECPEHHKMALDMMKSIYYAKKIEDDIEEHDFNYETAKEWVSKMDPPAKWTIEETTAVAEANNISFDHISNYCWWVALNKMWSDYNPVIESIDVIDKLPIYVGLARGWLFDKDSAVTPKEKMEIEYNYLMKK